MVRPLEVGRTGSGWAFRLRLAVAVVGSAYAVLLTAAMARAAIIGGPTDLALSFFATGVLVLILLVALPRTWRWALTSRPRPRRQVLEPGHDPEPGRHRGLSGEVDPPTRW